MNVLMGYVVAYTYLLSVFIAAFVVSRILKNNEISRNIIHIAAGMGWNIFKIFFPASIHAIIISSSLVLVTILTITKKVKFVERNDKSYGTLYYTTMMLIMSILGYKNKMLFDLFGISIMCLSCGDAFANIIGSKFGSIKIYKKKSLQGTISCLFICIIVITAEVNVYGIKLNIIGILLLSLLSATTELFSGRFDNISIPSVVYCFGYILITDGLNQKLLISLSIGAGMFIFALTLKLLNINASYMLFYFITFLFYFGGLQAFISVMLIFSIIIFIEKICGYKINQITKPINKESGKRNEMQLSSNCLAAVLAICLYGITNSRIFLLAFFSAIAETIGDSAASDLGILSKRQPFDICSFKKIQRGISGGITILGTSAGLLVCIFTGIIYISIYKGTLLNSLIIISASFLGIILDSILGSAVQAKYQCSVCGKITEKTHHCQKDTLFLKGFQCIDNSRVNLICNFFSGILAGTVVLLMSR